MLVQIRDSAALSSISIVSLRAYLNSREWTDAGVWGERPITIFAREHDGRTWEILVPHRDTIAGYAENMAEAVAVLAEVEERSQLDVFYDLSATSCDVVRLHSLNGVAKEPLSLRRSTDLLQGSYSMLGYVARSVDSPSAAYRGGPKCRSCGIPRQCSPDSGIRGRLFADTSFIRAGGDRRAERPLGEPNSFHSRGASQTGWRKRLDTPKTRYQKL